MRILAAAVMACALSSAVWAAVHRSRPKTAAARPIVERRGVDKSALAGLSSLEKQWVQRWTRRMNVSDLAAQLILVPYYGEAPKTRSREYQKFVRQVRDLRVGGFLILNRSRKAEPYASAAFLNRMQRLARIPLIMAGDFERGASMRMTDTTPYPHNMAYAAAGDLEASRRLGAATAREARAMGFQWIFAPVADVNNNPDNPIINIRSYGEDPRTVAAHVRAYIEGAHSDPRHLVLCTAKHFPGHGDTSTDSHLGLATLTAPRQRLDQVELVPFRAAIDARVDAIMTAHVSVPALEPESIPATVSANVLTRLLRDELKFQGLVVTDAMDMQGLTGQFPPAEAAVRALEAGADILLMPSHPEASVAAAAEAVADGRLPRARLERSVVRLLAAKVRVGLQKSRMVAIEDIGDEMDPPESEEEAQRVADQAVTLLKNDAAQVPIAQPDAACVLVLTESRGSQQGRAMLEELRARAPQARTQVLDPALSPADLDQAVENTAACRQVVVAAFAGVTSYRGTAALAGEYTPMLDKLLAGPKPVTLIALGNPYLLRSFPTVAAYLATYSTVAPSERAAVKAILGAIPIRGRSPVSIPGCAKIGDGIQVGTEPVLIRDRRSTR